MESRSHPTRCLWIWVTTKLVYSNPGSKKPDNGKSGNGEPGNADLINTKPGDPTMGNS